jgi:hypothetical protein
MDVSEGGSGEAVEGHGQIGHRDACEEQSTCALIAFPAGEGVPREFFIKDLVIIQIAK